MRDLQRPEHSPDFLEIGLRRLQIARVAAADLDAVLLEHPPRRAAHFPFGAGIRAGTQNHPQAFLLRDAAKLRVVRLAAPVELSLLRLVQIPEQVGANGIQTHCLRHPQTLAPVLLGHARGVDFAAANLHSLSVEQKIIRADDERVARGRGHRISLCQLRGCDQNRQNCKLQNSSTIHLRIHLIRNDNTDFGRRGPSFAIDFGKGP